MSSSEVNAGGSSSNNPNNVTTSRNGGGGAGNGGGVAGHNESKHHLQTRLPWGALKEKHNYYFYPSPGPSATTQQPQTPVSASGQQQQQQLVNLDNVGVDRKKPGEYVMHLMTLNYINICSRKLDQLINGDKRVSGQASGQDMATVSNRVQIRSRA